MTMTTKEDDYFEEDIAYQRRERAVRGFSWEFRLFRLKFGNFRRGPLRRITIDVRFHCYPSIMVSSASDEYNGWWHLGWHGFVDWQGDVQWPMWWRKNERDFPHMYYR